MHAPHSVQGRPGGRILPRRLSGHPRTDRVALNLSQDDAHLAEANELERLSAITARVREHLNAGADHVILGVLADDRQPEPTEVARQLAHR